MEKTTNFSEYYGVSQDETDEKKKLVQDCNKCLDEIAGLIMRFMARAKRFPPVKELVRNFRIGDKDIVTWPLIIRKDGLFTLGADGVLYNVIGTIFAEKFSVKKLEYDPDVSIRTLVMKRDTLESIKNALSSPSFGKVLPTLPDENTEDSSENLDDPFWKRIGKYALGYLWMSLIVAGVILIGIWLLYLKYFPHYNL